MAQSSCSFLRVLSHPQAILQLAPIDPIVSCLMHCPSLAVMQIRSTTWVSASRYTCPLSQSLECLAAL